MNYQQKSFNNQQVQNNSSKLNDRDRINDILATEKYLTDSFNTFIRESSNNQLYGDVKQILNDTHDCARDVFNLMYQQGSYQLEAAPTQKIQQVWSKFSNYLNTQSPY
ncbi:MAG: spore coat protein [Halanaerobiales bacterium]